MEKFALLFEIREKSQVLVYREYDPEEDTTTVHHIASFNGCNVDAKVGLSGDNQEENSDKYLQEYTQEKAEKFYTEMEKMLS